MTEAVDMAFWGLLWLGVASMIAVGLWLIYDTVDRALDLRWPPADEEDPDVYTRPLRPAGERTREWQKER